VRDASVALIGSLSATVWRVDQSVVKGSHVLRNSALDKEIEIVAIKKKSVVITANSESHLIRLSSPEDTKSFEESI